MFLLAVRHGGDDPGVAFEGSCAALLDRHPGMAADVARWEEELALALEEELALAADPPVLVRMEGIAAEQAHEAGVTAERLVWFAGEAPPFAWLAWLADKEGAAGPVVWAFRDEAHMLSTQPEAGVNGSARRAWFARAAAWGAAQREGEFAGAPDGGERPVARGAFGHTLRLLAARIGEGFC
jgi:hypothetical protein